jgi:hypothetical protein
MNQARSFIGSYLLVRGLRPPLRGAASNRIRISAGSASSALIVVFFVFSVGFVPS